MAIDKEFVDRLLEEERPGPEDLESALATETLSDVVTQAPIVLDEETPLGVVIRQMQQERRAVVLLVNDGRLTGIFTERDVLMKIASNDIDLESIPTSDYMTPDPMTLPAESSVAFALNKMIVEGFRHIPIVDDEGRPQTVISMRNLIEYLSDFWARDVLNVPPDPRMRFRDRDGA